MQQSTLSIDLSPDDWLAIQDAVDAHTRALDDVGRERESGKLFAIGQRLRRVARAALARQLDEGGQT